MGRLCHFSVFARVGGVASCLGGKLKKRKRDGEPKTADDVPAVASSGLEAGGLALRVPFHFVMPGFAVALQSRHLLLKSPVLRVPGTRLLQALLQSPVVNAGLVSV